MPQSRTVIVLAAAGMGLLAGLGGAVVLLQDSPSPSSRSAQPASAVATPTLVPTQTQPSPAVSTAPVAAPATNPARPAEPQRTPGLKTVECWFTPSPEIPSKCVHLFVREKREDPNSAVRRLSAVVFESQAANKEPPLAFLVGGPGEPARIASGELERWWTWIRQDDWLKGRDLVVLDQRGVGLSEPDMACPEMASAGLTLFKNGATLAETGEQWRQAGEACARRLDASGIDTTQYNTRTISADLHELLSGLGYRSWYLFGVSFGTRVVLSFMRDYPDGTLGAILDSVYPPNVQAYVESARSASAAFATLFKQCADNPGCRKAYPDLARKFETVVRRAEKSPYVVTIEGPPAMTLKIDHARLIEVLFYAFYGWRDITQIPVTVAALEEGDTRPLAGLAQTALRFYEWQGSSHGLFLSVTCNDEMPMNPKEAVAAEAARQPLFEAFALSNPPLTACPNGEQKGALRSSDRGLPTAPIPTLVLSGELDPITPPSWAVELAKQLPKATLVRFNAVGHGVVSSHSCADRLIGEFLRDPSKPPFDPCQLALGPANFTAVSSNAAPSRGGNRSR